MGASILVLRSGHPRDRPLLRRWFPFIKENFYSKFPAADFLVPFWSLTLFLPIIKTLFQVTILSKKKNIYFYLSTFSFFLSQWPVFKILHPDNIS